MPSAGGGHHVGPGRGLHQHRRGHRRGDTAAQPPPPGTALRRRVRRGRPHRPLPRHRVVADHPAEHVRGGAGVCGPVPPWGFVTSLTFLSQRRINVLVCTFVFVRGDWWRFLKSLVDWERGGKLHWVSSVQSRNKTTFEIGDKCIVFGSPPAVHVPRWIQGHPGRPRTIMQKQTGKARMHRDKRQTYLPTVRMAKESWIKNDCVGRTSIIATVVCTCWSCGLRGFT